MREADFTPIDVVPRLPKRSPEGHKGTYGKVLVVAGSRGMSGAAVLCGRAALRSGAGLVQVGCPAFVQPEVAAAYPGFTTLGFDAAREAAIDNLSDAAQNASSLAIGPGLGQSPEVAALVQGLLARFPNLATVVDADALNVLAPFTDAFKNRPVPLVLTPHPGEFARLTGGVIPSERERASLEFASRFGVVLVLKGMGTIVTDGQRLYRNSTGNPGMATGGSGDVLSGCIAALLAQGLSPLDAAVLGTWVHGRAGDMAARQWGQVGLTAVDLPDALALAFRELEQ